MTSDQMISAAGAVSFIRHSSFVIRHYATLARYGFEADARRACHNSPCPPQLGGFRAIAHVSRADPTVVSSCAEVRCGPGISIHARVCNAVSSPRPREL